jgi:alkylhydroperoxidase family enzyme
VTTWLPAEADGDTPFARVFGLRPDLYEPYQDFIALFWQRGLVDPVLLELCRLRVARLLGCESELALRTRTAVDAGLTDEHVAALAHWPTAEGFSDAQRAALGLAEQFVIDPSGVDDDLRARVRSHLSSAELVALVEALALFDGFTRFALLLCNDEDATVRVVDPPPAPPGEPPAPSEDADPAISKSALSEQPEALVAFLRLYGTLWSHGQVEQRIKEVARLRNARITNCAYCRSVRFEGARAEGLSEDRVDLINDGYATSVLSEREKVVLRYTDTFLREPGDLTDDLRRDMLGEFSAGDVVELTTGIALFMGFSKIAVTLGPPPEMPVMVVPTPDWP